MAIVELCVMSYSLKALLEREDYPGGLIRGNLISLVTACIAVPIIASVLGDNNANSLAASLHPIAFAITGWAYLRRERFTKREVPKNKETDVCTDGETSLRKRNKASFTPILLRTLRTALYAAILLVLVTTQNSQRLVQTNQFVYSLTDYPNMVFNTVLIVGVLIGCNWLIYRFDAQKD